MTLIKVTFSPNLLINGKSGVSTYSINQGSAIWDPGIPNPGFFKSQMNPKFTNVFEIVTIIFLGFKGQIRVINNKFGTLK